ncbi:MAG: helix-turn-helix transcriptional regulator [Lachnospiraceae bacterium]|nr:helix-turn-helix transcriptional regulator [Lachnospiraceae bacterium]
MIISDRIFMLLKERKISQAEFSAATGISPSAISDWKRKGTNPSIDRIIPICEFLNVSPAYLLNTSDTPLKKSLLDYTDEENNLIETYRFLNHDNQNRTLGYMDALMKMQKTDTDKK